MAANYSPEELTLLEKLYGNGYSPKQIETLLKSIDHDDMSVSATMFENRKRYKCRNENGITNKCHRMPIVFGKRTLQGDEDVFQWLVGLDVFPDQALVNLFHSTASDFIPRKKKASGPEQPDHLKHLVATTKMNIAYLDKHRPEWRDE